MALTSEQELEMYANIQVIKNNCLNCSRVQQSHEKRITALERAYWIFIGVSTVITFILPFYIQHFLSRS